MKTISNIVAVTIGSAASVLFIVLFSQTASSTIDTVIPFPQLILLFSGIALLICGVVGLLSANKVIFLVCSLLSLVAPLTGLFFTEHKLIFAVLSLILFFTMASNLIQPKRKPVSENEDIPKATEKKNRCDD